MNRYAEARQRFQTYKIARFVTAKDYWQALGLCTPICLAVAIAVAPHFSLGKSGAAIGFGLLCWTLFEYLTHRFTFHVAFYLFREKWKIAFIHNNHHAAPEEGVNAGMISSLYMLSVCLLINFVLTRDLKLSLVVLIGNALGHMAYEWIHYQEHFHKTDNFYVRYMTSFHDTHHYKNIRCNFGITSPLWDILLGTFHWPARALAKTRHR